MRHHSEKYRSRYGRAPANKGAHCVARRRVYSRVLRCHVLRCRKFEGGRVGIRKPPYRKTDVRCTRRKKVYSPFFRKKVLRCAKFARPAYAPRARYEQQAQRSVTEPFFPFVTSTQSAVWSPPSSGRVMVTPFHRTLLLPADAKSLKNREREQRKMYSKLSRQMRKLKPGAQSQTMSRWPK